jgi:hypothetical protein
MLSTAQALQALQALHSEWEGVLKLLTEVKAHVVAHPDEPILPAPLVGRSSESAAAVQTQLASHVATWKQLLSSKVSQREQSDSCSRCIESLHCTALEASWEVPLSI